MNYLGTSIGHNIDKAFRGVVSPPSIRFFMQEQSDKETDSEDSKENFEYDGRLNDLFELKLKGIKRSYQIDSSADYSEIKLGEFKEEIDTDELNIQIDNGGLENLRD